MAIRLPVLKLLTLHDEKHKLQYAMNNPIKLRKKRQAVFFKIFMNTSLFAVCSTKNKLEIHVHIYVRCRFKNSFLYIGYLSALFKHEQR